MHPPKYHIALLLIGSIVLYQACQQEAAIGPLPDKVDFNFHIRPILSNNCYLCHGPDPSSREADLRLDLEATATALLDNGKKPIHPNNWQESEVIRRITSEDPDIHMPPPEMNKRLSAREVALLKKWIDQGAEWKKYWAFIPPEIPTEKGFEGLTKPSDKIDFLINKELKANGLSVTEKADKNALTRRLSYLLTGLPPSLEILEQPTNSQPATRNSKQEYERLVDEFLSSPHFGERWARHWMDLTRYAEYKGHEFDYPIIGAWQYRDYLIRAFNADVPYNQLVKEHLAGDLLENPRLHPEKGTNESVHGTQFFTFSENKHSPVSIKEEEATVIDNMIDVTTKTFQGLTVACARCHDHKFDAIPTTDYYSLYGMFESTRFALLPSETGLAAFEKVDSIKAIKLKLKELLVGDEAKKNSGLSMNTRKTSPYWQSPFLPQRKPGASKGEEHRANDETLGAVGNDISFVKSELEKLGNKLLRPISKTDVFPPLEGARGRSVPSFSNQTNKSLQNPRYFKSPDSKFLSSSSPDEQNDATYKKILTNLPVLAKAKIIADFRDGTLNGWTSNGLAFHNQNALGEPIFDKNGRFIKLNTAKASSRILGTGIQGALRSPTFIIDKEKLLVRAAGDSASIRLIVDNFQLIQDPIYGSLQHTELETTMRDYVFDLSMVQGRKAYIEIQGGKPIAIDYKQHYFSFAPTAWIEVEYAFLYDGEKPPPPPIPNNFEIKNKQTAIQNWIAGKANPKEVKLVNQVIKKGSGRLNTTEIAKLKKEWNRLAESLYDSTFFQGVTEGDAQLSPVFIRGNRNDLSKEKVPHQFFHALKDYSPEFPAKGSGRKQLAEGIANARNPLTARVMVNRIWQHLFGRGLVETVDNFGLQGKPPSHPELLDFLAIQFIADGWSIKKMIKHIVLTDAFQRSTIPSKNAAKKDPQNIYLSHFSIRRLEAEAIRDGLLAVSGKLDKKMYGEPFEIYLTDFVKGRGRPRNSGPLDGYGRRSIYQAIRRNFLPPFMLTFDMPAPFSTFGKRNVSNVPAQSLAMMNNRLIQELAGHWATKLMDSDDSFEQKIELVYLTAFSRKPTAEDLANATEFFEEQAVIYVISKEAALEDIRVWTDYCHAVFMMKEFIYLI